MKNTHTPAPWHACDNGDKTYHIAPDSAFVGGKRWYQDKVATGIQSEADARLIAAAPDLLAALIELASGHSMAGEEMARAAIAKATK